jgi:hypothetical protein
LSSSQGDPDVPSHSFGQLKNSYRNGSGQWLRHFTSEKQKRANSYKYDLRVFYFSSAATLTASILYSDSFSCRAKLFARFTWISGCSCEIVKNAKDCF